MGIQTSVAAEALADILRTQDKYKKADVSTRAEGTMQAVVVIFRDLVISDGTREILTKAIVGCCEHYGQTESIGRGAAAVQWPTNRYALEALQAIGAQKPSA